MKDNLKPYPISTNPKHYLSLPLTLMAFSSIVYMEATYGMFSPTATVFHGGYVTMFGIETYGDGRDRQPSICRGTGRVIL
jgi:hypothetical protein